MERPMRVSKPLVPEPMYSPATPKTARDNLQQGLNTATRSFQQIIDPFMQVLAFNGPQTEELAQRWSEKAQGLIKAGTLLPQGTQKGPQEVCGLVQDCQDSGAAGPRRTLNCPPAPSAPRTFTVDSDPALETAV